MKLFNASWGEGYVSQGSKVITENDINEANGWDEETIKKLMNAHVGEAVNCTDYSGVLFVQRIE